MAPGGEPTASLMDEPEESSAGDVGHSARHGDDGGGGGVRSESVNGDKNGDSEAMKPGGGEKNGGEGMRGLRADGGGAGQGDRSGNLRGGGP